MKTFFAIKRTQQHIYDKNGKRLFVTRLTAEPLTVVQVKNIEKDKYMALQIAFGQKKQINKPLTGHCKNIDFTPKYMREIRLDEAKEIKVGDKVNLTDVLQIGDIVKVSSVSKGKGFAGAMKRHGFHGGPKTHGQSDRPRSVGSIGQGTSPGRIWKGKRMAGRMGNETISIMGGQVVKIDSEDQLLWITGSVAGGKNAVVEINKIREGKFVGLGEEEKKEPVKVEKVEEVINQEEKQELPTEAAKDPVQEKNEKEETDHKDTEVANK